MFRRAVLGFVPTFLALAILCGTPVNSIGAPEASATSWDAKSWGATRAPTPVVRGSLTQDVPDIAVNQTADDDDTPDDRIVRVVSAVVWPDPALDTRLLRASDRAGHSHRPCAAPPRAPPTD
jgi:hypothetical protein